MITVVDFWAKWCTTCKQAKPFLEQLAEQGVVVEYVDVDEHPKQAQLLMVRSLPTFHVYVDDGLVETISGSNAIARLKQTIEELKEDESNCSPAADTLGTDL